MKIVKEIPPRDMCPVADLRFSLDALSKRLHTKLQLNIEVDDESNMTQESSAICMVLSTGRYATLGQTSMRGFIVEIGLEVHEAGDDDAFFEEDLNEVLDAIGIEEEHIKVARHFVRIRHEHK